MGNKFDELWRLFVRICNAGGILSFNTTLDVKEVNWKLKFHQKFCITATSAFVTTMLYTLVTVTENFVTTIFGIAGLLIYVTVYFGPLKLVWDYERFIKVIDWCRKLHNDENFDPNVAHIAKRHISTAVNWSMKIMSNITRLLVLDAFVVTIVWAAVGQLWPGNVLLDKYRAPMPFILPIKNQDTWTAFFVNLMIQFCGNYVGTVLGGLFMSIFMTVFLHFSAYLDVVLEVVEKANLSKKSTGFIKVMNAQDADLIEVLREIDEETTKHEDVTKHKDLNDFDHFVETVVDMLADFYE